VFTDVVAGRAGAAPITLMVVTAVVVARSDRPSVVHRDWIGTDEVHRRASFVARCAARRDVAV